MHHRVGTTGRLELQLGQSGPLSHLSGGLLQKHHIVPTGTATAQLQHKQTQLSIQRDVFSNFARKKDHHDRNGAHVEGEHSIFAHIDRRHEQRRHQRSTAPTTQKPIAHNEHTRVSTGFAASTGRLRCVRRSGRGRFVLECHV